jgi:hypothetical protein
MTDEIAAMVFDAKYAQRLLKSSGTDLLVGETSTLIRYYQSTT